MSIQEILFYLVILLANIIQGITGFAGTILAMPASLMLVGYDVAKPVLNALGLLSGIYVFVGHYKSVQWKEFLKVVVIMAVGIMGGMGIKSLLAGQEGVLYMILGAFVIFLAVQGLYVTLRPEKEEMAVSDLKDAEAIPVTSEESEAEAIPESSVSYPRRLGNFFLLVAAGIVHGIFVSGGPLLVSYLTKVLKDKEQFRSTISTVWIILNGIIFVSDISTGMWTASLWKTGLITVPFLFLGMFIGAKLYKIMSQHLFMLITYVLLFISGIMLLLKG